mmetsp:Transcript_52768/g.127919  ORF Transcript_52768/g.127919 Transcript_52768/m.127919 type:complete len:783 (-) Transcript_52768:91-2439(-)
MEMTKNNEKNAGAAAATTAAAAAAGHATFAWEKRFRRLVDDYTFEEYQHVGQVPRIEDHAHENVDVVVALPDVFVSSKPSSTFSLCDSFKSKSTIATSSTTSSSRSSATTTTSTSILASPKIKPKVSPTTTTTTKRSATAIPTGSTSKSKNDGSSHSTSGSTSTPKQSRRKIKPGSDHSSSRTRSKTDNVLSPRSASKKKNLTETSDHSSSRRSKTSTTSSSSNSRKNVDGSSDHSSSPRKASSSSSSSTSKKKLLSPSSSTPKTKKKLVKKISSSTTDSSNKVDSESNHSSASGASSSRTPRSKKTPKSSSSPRKKVSIGGDLASPTKRKPGTPSKATKNTVVQGDLNIPSLFTASFTPTSSSTTISPRSAKTTPRVTNKKTISSSLSSSSSPLKKKSNGGLGAFLHQNAVEQFTDKILKSAAAASSSDDGMSVGSKSISSKSVSELSHAERSKAEDSIPRKSWWKSRRAATTSNLRNQMFAVRSDSARSLNESNDDVSLSKSGRTNGMLSIDEMSTTDFSEAPPIPASPHGVASNKSNKSPVGRTSPSTSSRNSPKSNSPVSQGGDLGTFLQKSYFSKLQDDDDDDGDDNEETELTMAMLNGSADDMQSVASASTFGHRSISELSTAEQSRSELRLRDRSKKRKDSTTESTKTVPTSPTVEKSDEKSMLDKQKEPEEVEVQAPAPRVSHPPKSCLRPCKYGGGNSNAVNDTNNDSMKLDDLAADLSDNKLIKFKDGHSQKEIPDLTDSLYDILFYTEEQLADFRYEAFLEECGLDVDEFM